MRSVNDVIAEYDSSKKIDRQKIKIIEWFQQHPGQRFDRMEVHQELREELGVGQKSVGDYLNALAEESVLQSHGSQRISYRLADDILIPIRYQARAGLRHLYAIFDVKRWGVGGFIVISTVVWALLTLPFLVFSAVLLVSPSDRLGPIPESNMLLFAIGMTVWLVILMIASFILHRYRRWRISAKR